MCMGCDGLSTAGFPGEETALLKLVLANAPGDQLEVKE